ncbi:MAG: undecaprenyl/decaprenyl-phosphate alpha-N-acetylglucosaminyl 1-phosphate transferase [Cyclobacteriaceae bacterium]|nr:undecaprenyl/decaprenyl-phosphate alpha-N-acetylglucosaminyl 1-phosphate transferase [Cyclobacteriaceae bacterium]
MLLFPLVIKIFKNLNWFDAPGTHKIHAASVPSMGGVAIMIGAILALLMGLPLQQWIERKYFFISLALMFLIGLRDDVLALTPRQKLMSQFLPVLITVFLDKALLNSFYEWNSEPLPPYLSYLVSFVVIIIVSNAYNLIDGIDGLAGAIGLIVLLSFGIWFIMTGDRYTGLVALCFAGALLAFLVFNWQPSSIFMGDTGALTIGLLLSIFAIRFINVNSSLPPDHAAKFTASISTSFCILIVPLFDTFRVILIRLRKFQSPFHADRNHIHHGFLAAGMSHAQAVVWIALMNAGFVGLAIMMRKQPDWVLLPVIVIACLLINFVLHRIQKKPV